MLWIAIVAALLAGAANPFQAGTNAQLNKQLHQPVLASAWVYLSGLAGVLLVMAIAAFVSRQLYTGVSGRFSTVPWWAWLGGVISIVSTMVGLSFAQRLGSGLFTGLTLTASIVTSVLLDQFALVGFRQHSASPGRIAGCFLLVAGVWLVARF